MILKTKSVWPNDYEIRLIDMPCSIKALVSMGDDGFYNIYINSKLSREEQCRAAAHELNHIALDDFYNNKDIRSVEGL